jgi:ATP-dependent DNA helicase
MSASSVASAKSDPTPDSSPPPANMDDDSVSKEMQDEETRMRAQREKRDAKRDAQLEKERQEDIKSGKDMLDKKFQQLEFLMNKSKVRDQCRCERLVADFSSPALRDGDAAANAAPGRR